MRKNRERSHCSLKTAVITLSTLTVSLWLCLSMVRAQSGSEHPIRWQDCLSQSDDWYGGLEATRIAGNVIRYQRASGGWPKNIDMAQGLSDRENVELAAHKDDLDATIDNAATTTQIAYLARVFGATRQKRLRDSALSGIDYLVSAQYDNGGWPQYYPRPEGYHRHITFNDDAMIHVMDLLDAVAHRHPVYRFVDERRRIACERGVRQGVECILACQVTIDGRPTAWCAQHDEKSFEPASARTYEKISLSGMETVGIVRFLMRQENPDSSVIAAINNAVAWLEKVKLAGIRVEQRTGADLPNGRDRVVVQDAGATALWARFYEIGSNRPIFSGRDGVVKYSLAEIEAERRNGYQWYGTAPAKLLAQEYPAWCERIAATRNRRD
ncbi:MAG: pectate lyase [Acidobacteriota bacterium]